jgi:hypothetical protein
LFDAAFVCAELLCTAGNGSVGAASNSIIDANERLGGSLPSVKTLLVCLTYIHRYFLRNVTFESSCIFSHLPCPVTTREPSLTLPRMAPRLNRSHNNTLHAVSIIVIFKKVKKATAVTDVSEKVF